MPGDRPSYRAKGVIYPRTKKEKNKNYLLLNTYRPIALKNILIKLAEKVLTIHIIEKAKAETLLL